MSTRGALQQQNNEQYNVDQRARSKKRDIVKDFENKKAIFLLEYTKLLLRTHKYNPRAQKLKILK